MSTIFSIGHCGKGLSAEQIVEVLRAVGEPTRLRILRLLAHEELAVMELALVLEQSQPRVSRHLRVLADAALVGRSPKGPKVFYRLGRDPARGTLVNSILSQFGASNRGDWLRLELIRRNRLEQICR